LLATRLEQVGGWLLRLCCLVKFGRKKPSLYQVKKPSVSGGFFLANVS
jgi:hypothetical protein